MSPQDTPRRVALDVRKLQDRPLGGVGRVLENLLPRLCRAVSLVALSDPRKPSPGLPETVEVVPLPARGPALESLWLQTAVPRFLRGFEGVFHCPAYALPFEMPVPMVVTIHDLSFEEHPEWFTPARRLAYRLQARHAARKAAAILTVSEYVRCKLLERYRVDPDRVLVARSGVDPRFRPDPDPEALARWLAGRGITTPYGVALAGAPRRGLSAALEAVALLRRDHPEFRLVVVGRADLKDRSRADQAARSANQAPKEGSGRVLWLGPIRDEELAWVLRGASVLVYPTRDEGFGMPALEAAACGTPVVCAPVGALPEVLGPAAYWVPEPEPEPIAHGVAAVLSDASLAARLAAAGLERVRARGGWEAATAATLEAYALASEAGLHGPARRRAA